MKSNIATLTSLALLVFGLGLNANAQALYRWVDQDGKVQYSDMPPPANAKNTQQKRLGDNLIEQDKLPYALKMAMQSNPITLYTSDCGSSCDQARSLLNKRGIPFAERNPEKDADAAKALGALIGALQVPTLVIGDSNFKGFLESGWNSALDSAGYPRSNPLSRPPAAAAKVPPAAPDSGDIPSPVTP